VEALEKTAITDPQAQQSKDLSDRISDLVVLIRPSNEILQEAATSVGAKQNNWFLNPPDVPWMNSLGRGIKKAGKGIAKAPVNMATSAHSVITSPEFLMLTAAAGLLVGAYYLGRSMPATTYRSEYGYGPGHACTGSTFCQVCINCNDCEYCNTSARVSYCNVYYAHH
jgi:hypothetical protein